MAIIARTNASNIRNRCLSGAGPALAIVLVLLVCGVPSLWAADELP